MPLRIHYTKWVFKPLRLSLYDFSRLKKLGNNLNQELELMYPKGSFAEEEKEVLLLLKKVGLVFILSFLVGLGLYMFGVSFSYAMIGCWISGGILLFISGGEFLYTYTSYTTYVNVRKRFLRRLIDDIRDSKDYEHFCSIRNYPSSVVNSQLNRRVSSNAVHFQKRYR